MSYDNDIDVEVELDNGQIVTYNVQYSYTKGAKERKYGHPDTWHPAEGAEVDIYAITYEKPLTKLEFSSTLNLYEGYFIEQIVKKEEGHD